MKEEFTIMIRVMSQPFSSKLDAKLKKVISNVSNNNRWKYWSAVSIVLHFFLKELKRQTVNSFYFDLC